MRIVDLPYGISVLSCLSSWA